MENIKIINETEDKSIEEIIRKVLAKSLENNEFSDEVIIIDKDEENGEIYLSSGDINYTTLLQSIEACSSNEYSVSWGLYKEINAESKEQIEIASGEDIIEFGEEIKEEDDFMELKFIKNNIDKRYIIGDVDDDLRVVADEGNSERFINDEFKEYLEKHGINDIEFIIKPYGVEDINRIQFEISQANDNYSDGYHKTILCLRKGNENNGEFKLEDRFLAYEESCGQHVLNLITDFMDEYYVK